MLKINKKFINQQEYKIATSSTKDVTNLAIIENFNKHCFNTENDINFYPTQNEEYHKLLQEISTYCNVSEENILVTNGSGKALDMILHAFTDETTRILIPTPNYPGFIHSAELSPGIVETLEFDNTNENYITFISKVEKSDVIYLSIPNLPLGYIFDRNILIDLIINNPNKLFIVDEAYIEYAGVPSFINTTLKNLVVTRTFSKAFALAGARIGYIIANKSIIDVVRIGYNFKDILNSSIKNALLVITNKSYYLDNVKNDMKLLNYIKERLQPIINPTKVVYDLHIPNGPWFLIFTQDTNLFCNIMLKNKYLVRDKSSEIRNCVRISLCNKTDIEEICEIIEEMNNKKAENVIFDLDGTLRKDYKSSIDSSVIQNWEALNIKYNVKIVTNNVSNKSEILQYLHSNKLYIKDTDLICPINDCMNSNNFDWFVYENKVYILRFPTITHHFINTIVQYNEIAVVEKEYSTSSGEMGEYPDLAVPHIGYFLEFIKKEYPKIKVTLIGKEALLLPFDSCIMVGDTDIDKNFAKMNNFRFVDIRKYNISNIISWLI